MWKEKEELVWYQEANLCRTWRESTTHPWNLQPIEGRMDMHRENQITSKISKRLRGSGVPSLPSSHSDIKHLALGWAHGRFLASKNK